MKYVKILGLLAVAAAAMMAFAATASATTVTSDEAGSFDLNHVHGVHEGTHVILDSAVGPIECNSTATIAGTSGTQGATNVIGHVTSLLFEPCTGGWHVTTIEGGQVTIDNIAGTKNGTLTSDGAVVKATIGGITCAYATNNTHIGTLTGGTPSATLDINALIPVVPVTSSPFCGNQPSRWTGSYKTTAALFVQG